VDLRTCGPVTLQPCDPTARAVSTVTWMMCRPGYVV